MNAKKVRTWCVSFLMMILLAYNAGAQNLPVVTSTPCNTPLVGQGRVVDVESGGLLSLLGGSGNVSNLLDRDLSNYVTFSTVVGSGSIVSVRDVKQSYAAGFRAGFVVSPTGSVLNVSVLSNFRIRTYLNNQVQETSVSLSLDSLNTSSASLKRISFVTTQPFDEIELVQTGISLLSSLNVYYGFVGPATGCNYSCITPVTTANGFSPAIDYTNSRTGLGGGLCLLCGVSNENNILTTSTTDFASINLTAGVAAYGAIAVTAGKTIPSGSDVGFVVALGSGLSLSLLGSSTIETYSGGTLKESKAFSQLLSINLLAGSTQAISFKTTAACNELRIVVNGISLLVEVDVYYAFARIDTDGDGIFDCADKCAGGNDNLDSNGNGIPDACDTTCDFNAGPDVTLCSQTTTYDLSNRNLGTGITWKVLSTSPSGATVDTNGNVTGMTLTGTYYIEVRKSTTCADTVAIIRREALINPSCDRPIVGTGVQNFTPSGETCLLCISGSSGSFANVTDGNLNNYIETASLASVISSTPLIGVKDTRQIYPAGTRTGFVIQALGGLLNATVLSNLQLETDLNGTLQETATSSNGLLTAGVISTTGNKQQIMFVTTKPFDALVLRQNSTISLSLLSGLRIYYAFEEPASGCDAVSGDCAQPLLATNAYKASIAFNHTGISSVACVACSISNIGNIINGNLTDYATINLTGAVVNASVSVLTAQTINGSYQAGFIISGDATLLNLTVLAGLQINTYLNGTLQDTYFANNSLVDVTLLGGTSNKARVSFLTSKPFNEIQLVVSGTVSALQNLLVYNAFIWQDSDGDGIPDCMDKCCLGPDYMVGDDGLPLACNIDVTYDASCRLCPVKVNIAGNGLSAGQTYSLYKGNTKIGDFTNNSLLFTADVSGTIFYNLNQGNVFIKNIPVRIHPAAATWNPASSTAVLWKDSANWTPDSGGKDYPLWCTDVTIPENTQSYPVLLKGDQCRDITFKNGASVGRIHVLKYRHAYVEFRPDRNIWMMTSAPLKYMYSADYSADRSWGNALEPKVFMRYFDVDYAQSNIPNPDGVKGTSVGNFSKAFVNMQESLTAGLGFVLWVNGGSKYREDYFPTDSSYLFPRRDVSGNDVQYSYHYDDGSWAGNPFYLSPRGNNIQNESEWTATSVPDTSNRYRFVYEGLLDTDSILSVSVQPSRTIIMGNPFMSHIDFDRFYQDNSSDIYNYYRIWNGEHFYSYIGSGNMTFSGLGNLTADDGTDISVDRYIAPIQSFFVETKNVVNPSLKFTPLASVANAGSKRKSQAKQNPDVLKITLKASGKTNSTIVALIPGASPGYDADEDIFKLFSPQNVPEIYTIADQTAIEINAVDFNGNNLQIPIGIRLSGTASMEVLVTGFENMDTETELYLLDRRDNKKYNLKDNNNISLEKTADDNLEGRFYLSLERNIMTTNNESSAIDDISTYVNDGFINVYSSAEITGLTLSDLSGKIYYSAKGSGKYFEQIEKPLPEGIFVLKVETASKTGIYKIIY